MTPEAKAYCEAQAHRIAELEADVASLRVDAERLNWIESEVAKGRLEIARSLLGKGYEFGFWQPGPNAKTHIGTFRAAIDAARGVKSLEDSYRPERLKQWPSIINRLSSSATNCWLNFLKSLAWQKH